MAGLLDLPSELLYQIIHLIVSSPLLTPLNGKRYQSDWNPIGRRTVCSTSKNMMEKPNALSLLLTNQRLCLETSLYLSKQPRVLNLDAAIIDGHWFWPTWRTVPWKPFTSTLDRIEMNITLCCSEQLRSCDTTWEHVPKPCRNFVRFFVQPPLRLSAAVLVINVQAADYANLNQPYSKDVIPLRQVDGLAHLDFELLYPLDISSANTYLHLLYTNAQADSTILALKSTYEGIDKIQFCMNGKVLKSVML